VSGRSVTLSCVVPARRMRSISDGRDSPYDKCHSPIALSQVGLPTTWRGGGSGEQAGAGFRSIPNLRAGYVHLEHKTRTLSPKCTPLISLQTCKGGFQKRIPPFARPYLIIFASSVTNLRPTDTEETPFWYTFKVQCTSCRETHPKPVGVSRFVRTKYHAMIDHPTSSARQLTNPTTIGQE
jgi:hypothetical protein